MTAVELYTKGARVWIPHTEEIWQEAELLEDYSPTKQILVLQTENNGDKKTLTIKSNEDLPFLKNPSMLIGENDLTSLSYLHEPAVLNNLRFRFNERNNIYTYCGIVLIAINPYQDLSIYDAETIQTYKGKVMGELDPHIFAVAEDAFRSLEREKNNQSIIVSGESGAGKTVSFKYTMQYLTAVAGGTTDSQIETKVLASSPIMEAFGSAKTTRNDNSSRFGKFIELQFNKHYRISGASMRTYLLEKSRVVFQTKNERNYHIFYQMCAAQNDLTYLNLVNAKDYHFLNQGDSPTIDNINDFSAFRETCKTMSQLGFTEANKENIFKILASILKLGNIQFVESESNAEQEGCEVYDANKNLAELCDLLGINDQQMEMWLTTKKLVSMRETILKPMSVESASRARDALAKFVYEKLFNWIVSVINKALGTDIPMHKFIGVLDIYGFEVFLKNSFEQFCINYANEKLQQQFNLHVFKLEQEEYVKEGIPWTMVKFYDNQPCIDLIENKMGILSLLDEECKMPKGSDITWAEKLYSKCGKEKHFLKARFGTTAFGIKHFADKVYYESDGFLEKNRDTVLEDQMNVLKHSKIDFIRQLFCSDGSVSTPVVKLKVLSAKPVSVSNKTNKKTVGSQFKDSLNLLMNTLNSTTPHYIRCIKPNDFKTAFDFNPKLVDQQLRACGVLETVEICSTGFPSRWLYGDFYYRYRILLKSKDITGKDVKQTCTDIIFKHLKSGSDKCQYGKTKIFFRAAQLAYLEKVRADIYRSWCIKVQSLIRGFVCKRKYVKIQRAVLGIQRCGRGLLARKHAVLLRQNRASIIIQRYTRGWVKRVQYRRLQRQTISLQAHLRGYLARRNYRNLKEYSKAVVIQKHVRGFLARKRYQKRIHSIVIAQAAVRRFLAKRQYKKLRTEARSIEHVKKLNKGLENKIISLQQRLDESTKQNNELKNVNNEVIELRTKLIQLRAMELEVKNLNKLVIEKNKDIEKVSSELKSERDDKVDLIDEYEKYRKQAEDQRELFASETAKLRKELDNINEIVLTNQKGAEETLRVRVEEVKNDLMSDLESREEDYQNLLQKCHFLETRNEELMEEIERLKQRFSINNREPDLSIIQEGNTTDSDESIRSTESTASSKSTKSTASSKSTKNTASSKSTKSTASSNKDLSLMTEFDEFMRQFHLRTQGRDVSQEEFTHFVQQAQVINREWRKSVDKCKRLQLMVDDVTHKNRDLDCKLIKSQEQFDRERRKTKFVEDERDNLKKVLEKIEKILFSNNQRNTVPHEVQEQFAFLHSSGQAGWDPHLSIIQEGNTTGGGDGGTQEQLKEQDVGLILQLQYKLDQTSREKTRIQKRLDELEGSPKIEKAEIAAQDAIRVAQLEVANSNLKSQLLELTSSVENCSIKNRLKSQLDNLYKELERRDEEIVQLKGVLVTQTDNMKSKVKTGEYINKDGELALAYETQKTINIQLELELQDEKSKYKAYEKEFKLEIEKLLDDNEKLQRLLTNNLSNASDSQNELVLKNEVTRFTKENVDLRNAIDSLQEIIKKLKNQIKALSRKESGLEFDTAVAAIPAVEESAVAHSRGSVVRKKKKEYLGMFAFKTNEENVIMKQLVIELRPRTAVSLLQGLPAYIVFMCIRHTDYVNDGDKLKSLLSAFTKAVEKIVKKRIDDFESLVLWLSNTLRLVNLLKQYSGDATFQEKNTPKQNKQSLTNFDLTEYRQSLTDIAVLIYQRVIRNLGEKVQPLIIPAILEHEENQGMGNKLSGFRGRTSGMRDIDSPGTKQKPTDVLLQELTSHYKMLTFYEVDIEVISQIFKQVFYFLCSFSLNNLLLRKELCHWSKGFQIRNNLSHFEMWTREKQLDETSIQSTLQPIIQAAQLLQARKTDEDVVSICEMCSALTSLQICKILNLYTPADEFEQRIPATFIGKVQEKLLERSETQKQQTLLMDIKYTAPVRFSFNPSVICLEDIEIPEILNLPLLEKV